MKNRFLKSISLIISALFIIQLSPTALTAENYVEEPTETEIVENLPSEEISNENFDEKVSEAEKEITETSDETTKSEEEKNESAEEESADENVNELIDVTPAEEGIVPESEEECDEQFGFDFENPETNIESENAPEIQNVIIPTDGAFGTCGDNATWKLTADGTLTIDGSGTMTDYSLTKSDGYIISTAPWYSYRQNINVIDIGHGITSIGNYASLFQILCKLKKCAIIKQTESGGTQDGKEQEDTGRNRTQKTNQRISEGQRREQHGRGSYVA